MSYLYETYTSRIDRATPGRLETPGDAAPRASITFGKHREWWFTDPAELAELEEAARIQRLRLEHVINNAPGAAAPVQPGPARTAQVSTTTPTYMGAVAEVDGQVGRPYIFQGPQAGTGETPGPTWAARP